MLKGLLHICFITSLLLSGCNKKDQKTQSKQSYDYTASVYYDYYNKIDSAFYFFDRVLNNSKDSLEKADVHFRIGERELYAGDYTSAQASYLSAIKILDQEDSTHFSSLASYYNSLATATLNLKDYLPAINSYYQALKFVSDHDYTIHILNNVGVVYQKQGNYQRSISILDSAIKLAPHDTILKARIISNLARSKWLAEPNYDALPEFMTSLSLRTLLNDSIAINASFSHLSDYYTNSRPDSALYYALKRFEVAERLDDPTDRLESLNKLIKVAPLAQTKLYSDQYIQLNDSLNDARSKDRNQYALIRFDAEKNKTDNLLLQKHIGTQRIFIWGTSLLGILAIIGILIRARIRRIKFKQQSENAIRDSRLRTSQKVHDVVANGLYHVMNELEHRETIDKEALLNKIEILYEKSRDISYEDYSIVDDEDYVQQIHQLLTAFETNELKVQIVGNKQAFWDKLSTVQKHELKLILCELMVNMQKHSDAKNAVVLFKQKNNAGYINYKDDGIGFPSEIQFGNGLKNTVTRTKSLKGEINFEKSGERGVSISISFPLKYPLP